MYKLNANDGYKEKNQELLEWLESKGWKIDNFGHATKEKSNGKKYRYKFQAISIRYEVQVRHEATQYSNAINEWIRVKTLSYKTVKVK